MIDETDRYWGGSPGRNWGELPGMLERLKMPRIPHSEAQANDRIARHEVDESNALMERLGLRTRYLPDGRAYQIQGKRS